MYVASKYIMIANLVGDKKYIIFTPFTVNKIVQHLFIKVRKYPDTKKLLLLKPRQGQLRILFTP